MSAGWHRLVFPFQVKRFEEGRPFPRRQVAPGAGRQPGQGERAEADTL
jgi:hypothetical protein